MSPRSRSPSLGSASGLSREARQRLEAILQCFADAWRRGEQPGIDDFLARAEGDAQRRALLVELVHEDLEFRFKAGEPVGAVAYLNRYPLLREDGAVAEELVAAELRLRQRQDACSSKDPAQHVREEEITVAAPATREKEVPVPPLAEQDLLPTVAPSPRDLRTPAPAADGVKTPGYEIMGELGRGGMGVVYKARQIKANRLVALKMILAGGHAGAADLARFRTEGEAIARLQHANIVQVYEVGEHDGQPFFSLELCEGGSLERKLAGTPQPATEAARLVEVLARAMHAAHQANVIHRDLKPSNVLLTSDGAPKITEFGLAKKLDEAGQTASNAIMGTPSYMAPEQAGGKSTQMGPTADVYALGAILYECLTGRPPFRAATVMDTLMQVVADEPVPPSQLQSKVPHDVETICLKCLHKEPARRYSSAAELADDLARFQKGEPVLARPVGLGERAAKWARRRPAVAGLLGAIVLLTVAALTAMSLLYGDAKRQAVAALAAEGKAKGAERAAKEKEDEAKAAAERADKQRTRAELLLYASQIQSAQRAWEAGELGVAQEHLEACRWDYRGWEHRYLYTLLNRNQVTLRGHTNWVNSVAISSDGTRIVSGGGNPFDSGKPGEVKVWDAATGKEIRTLKGHNEAVSSVAISSDGRRIVSGSGDSFTPGAVKVWDAATGQEVLSLKGHTSLVTSVAISPDGTRIVSSNGDFGNEGKPGEVKVWDAATGQELLSLKGHTFYVKSVAISTDGKRIVSGSDYGTVKVWDAQTGQENLSLVGHTPPVFSVAISPDGTRIVSGSHDKTVKVWDAATGKEMLSLTGHTAQVFSVAISRDGTRIVSGGDKTVKVWDAATGQQRLSLKGHTDQVFSVAISPDGTRIVSGSADKTVKVWDAVTGKEMFSLKGHTDWVTSVAISSDGTRIVSGSADKTVKVWDAVTGQEKLSLKGHTVAISSDGTRIVSGGADKTMKVWDAATGKELISLEGHTGLVTSVAICPDGTRIVSGSWDKPGEVKVWDAGSGQILLSLKGHTGLVTSVAISPDGMRIVSGSWDKTVKVWDARMRPGLRTLRGHSNALRKVAFHARTASESSARMPAARSWGGTPPPDSLSSIRPPASLHQQARQPPAPMAGSGPTPRARRFASGCSPTSSKPNNATATCCSAWHASTPPGIALQVEKAVEADDDFAAAFHLERLARVQFWDASLHLRLAHVLARLGRREQSATHLMRALFLNPRASLWPSDPGAAEHRGQHAARGRATGPTLAVRARFQLAAQQPNAPADSLGNLLLAQVAASDMTGAHQTMAALARRLGKEKDPQVATMLFDRALPVSWGEAG